MALPVVPEYITVHLGAPDAAAENITVPFAEYIKNVASSEIYPTWPENAIRANILAQISFTLNRIYTEYYRSRGYDFDITNSTQYDHAFVPDREIFENISRITDEIFNDYIVRRGAVEPLFARFCDGIETRCDGLSQWGSVTLAQRGFLPYEILQYYYGDDIDIIFDAPVGNNLPSYPGAPLKRGSFGEDVLIIKRELNRIGKNYPAIGEIKSSSAAFDAETENAVREFQKIFNLEPDGIVGKATWYKLKEVYGSVKRLSELSSEGLTLSEIDRKYPEVLRLGNEGVGVRTVQYYLSFIGFFVQGLPAIALTGVFDENTRDAVYAFQNKYGLSVDGVVGRDTWNKLMATYDAIVSDLPEDYKRFLSEIYPGRFLVSGDTGKYIVELQAALKSLSEIDPSLPEIEITGTFDQATENAVKAVQERLGLEQNGAVGPIVWSYIITRGNGY